MGLHDGHRQRCKRRYLAAGAEGMDDHQLLELLLFFAIPRQDTNETAHRLVRQFGSMQGVLRASADELMTVDGVGENAAVLLRLAGDMALRARCSAMPQTVLNSTERTGVYFMELLAGEKKELLYQVCLDGKESCSAAAASARAAWARRRSMCGRWWRTPCTPAPAASFWRTTIPAAWRCPPRRIGW